ncbi:hypothetical protein B0H14DRAFT_3461226 [Mycena olivaceomarginata]|nr:hypothetical protein B0H14DRAFT_3461226 [Mycena olivaceomarginata]
MAPTRTESDQSSPLSSPQSSPSKSARPKKIKWYLNQRGHMCQSHITLVRRRPKGVDVDPTDIKFHIFSANTLPELVAYTREIYYSVEFHAKMFDNLDEAAKVWECARESVGSRIMLATWNTDRALWFGIVSLLWSLLS